jgi:hypothetical protein
VTAQEIQRRREESAQSSGEFLEVQREALLLSNQIPTQRVLTKREELRPRFETIHGKIEKHLEFLREVEQLEKFLQNKERIIKDAKFTKATVINIKAGASEKRGPTQQELKGLEVE